MLGKRYDKKAFLIAACCLAISCVFMLLYVYCTYGKDNAISAIGFAKNHYFLSTEKQFFILNHQHQLQFKSPLKNLNIHKPIANMAVGKNSLWLIGSEGDLHHCHFHTGAEGDIAKFTCSKAKFPIPETIISAKIALSPDEQHLIVVDNNRNKVYALNTKSKQLVAVTKKSANLLNANQVLFRGNQLWLADTGRFRVIAWPLSPVNGLPMITEKPDVLLKTQGQAYYVLPKDDATLWVLESGSMLVKGKIREYKDQVYTRTIAHEIDEPMFMLPDLNGDAVLGSARELKINIVINDISKPFGGEALHAEFELLNNNNVRLDLISQLSLIGFFVLLLLPVLVLRMLGYDLNQNLVLSNTTNDLAVLKNPPLADTFFKQLSVSFYYDEIKRFNLRRSVVMFFLCLCIGIINLSISYDFRGLEALWLIALLLPLIVYKYLPNYRKLTFLPRHIVIEMSSGEVSYRYTQLSAVIHSRDHFILYSPKKAYAFTRSITNQAHNKELLFTLLNQYLPKHRIHQSHLTYLWQGLKRREIAIITTTLIFILLAILLSLFAYNHLSKAL
jgi:hypothetical protein